MTNIENFKSVIKRTGFESVPIDYLMWDSLKEKLDEYLAVNPVDFDISLPYDSIPDIVPKKRKDNEYRGYYEALSENAVIDIFGVAHEPGSAEAMHMTRMVHPMERFDSKEQFLAYPYADYSESDSAQQRIAVKKAHDADRIAMGVMRMTVWENAWYLRGMENLMMDMYDDSPFAETLFKKVTAYAVKRAESFAESGVDVIFIGDDIGMQNSVMMSTQLYCDWIKPCHKRVIDSIKRVNPNAVVYYHSCGYIKPFIPHLIEIGVDVLDPVQPECMDFKEIHDEFGDKLTFHGTIGTQQLMPFGSPEDIRRKVFENLDIAGAHGGLLVGPTHMLEIEVPPENILAYIEACRDYK